MVEGKLPSNGTGNGPVPKQDIGTEAAETAQGASRMSTIATKVLPFSGSQAWSLEEWVSERAALTMDAGKQLPNGTGEKWSA